MGAGILIGPLSLLLLSLISASAAAQNGGGGGGGGGGSQLWCVAKNNADDAALQAAIDWACGVGGADCGPIQINGPCYDGSDLQRTASYAFNDYYVKNSTSDGNCDFGNTAALTSLNPSHDKCKFPSSSNSDNGNFGGATTAYGSYISSNSSIARRWNGNGELSLAIFTILLLFLRWN